MDTPGAGWRGGGKIPLIAARVCGEAAGATAAASRAFGTDEDCSAAAMLTGGAAPGPD
jgi:hypothetical protein